MAVPLASTALKLQDAIRFTDQDFLNGHLLLRRGKAYKDSALISLKLIKRIPHIAHRVQKLVWFAATRTIAPNQNLSLLASVTRLSMCGMPDLSRQAPSPNTTALVLSCKPLAAEEPICQANC